jgi:hypothetical protein
MSLESVIATPFDQAHRDFSPGATTPDGGETAIPRQPDRRTADEHAQYTRPIQREMRRHLFQPEVIFRREPQ